MPQRQQQSLVPINIGQILTKYPLVSKRSEPISSLSEAVQNDSMYLSKIDREVGEGITLKWIKAQLIDVLTLCGAFAVTNESQVIIVARHIRKKYYYLTMSELTYFFESFINGNYGMLYVGKTINPQIILQAARSFESDVISVRAQKERDNTEQRKQKEKNVGINGWKMYCQKEGLTDQTMPMQKFLKTLKKSLILNK